MVAAKAKALGLDTLAQSVSIGYVIVFLIVLTLVLVLNKTTKAKLIGGIVTVGAFVLLPYWLLFYKSPAETVAIAKQETARDEWKAKYDAAKPIFEKLCAEQSQPIIKRVVEDVEGVLLLKVRPAVGYVTDEQKNVRDWPEAALLGFGRVTDGLSGGYPELFLMDWHWHRRMWGIPPVETRIWERRSSIGGQVSEVWEEHLSREGRKSNDTGESRRKKLFNGYSYVDVFAPDLKSRDRITGRNDRTRLNHPYPGLVFTTEATKLQAPRYGVTFEDNLDPALRKHWIAGTTVSVVDTQTNEVIAQQSFWAWDRSFGATGQVVPWDTNTSRCPAIVNPMTLIHTTLTAKQGN